MSVTVLDRDWDYDDDPQYAYDHFIPGFECFVCDQVSSLIGAVFQM